MLPGAPTHLLPAVSLPTVLVLARPGELFGVWLRGCRRCCRLRSDRRSLLLGADLGLLLLRRCSRVAVRHGPGIAVLPAERLLAWRTLQIVIGTSHLPSLDRLRFLYPDMVIRGRRIAVPIGLASPEEALAACAASRVPVLSSWIDYHC